jgi:hypothetical protein
VELLNLQELGFGCILYSDMLGKNKKAMPLVVIYVVNQISSTGWQR